MFLTASMVRHNELEEGEIEDEHSAPLPPLPPLPPLVSSSFTTQPRPLLSFMHCGRLSKMVSVAAAAAAAASSSVSVLPRRPANTGKRKRPTSTIVNETVKRVQRLPPPPASRPHDITPTVSTATTQPSAVPPAPAPPSKPTDQPSKAASNTSSRNRNRKRRRRRAQQRLASLTQPVSSASATAAVAPSIVDSDDDDYIEVLDPPCVVSPPLITLSCSDSDGAGDDERPPPQQPDEMKRELDDGGGDGGDCGVDRQAESAELATWSDTLSECVQAQQPEPSSTQLHDACGRTTPATPLDVVVVVDDVTGASPDRSLADCDSVTESAAAKHDDQDLNNNNNDSSGSGAEHCPTDSVFQLDDVFADADDEELELRLLALQSLITPHDNDGKSGGSESGELASDGDDTAAATAPSGELVDVAEPAGATTSPPTAAVPESGVSPVRRRRIDSAGGRHGVHNSRRSKKHTSSSGRASRSLMTQVAQRRTHAEQYRAFMEAVISPRGGRRVSRVHSDGDVVLPKVDDAGGKQQRQKTTTTTTTTTTPTTTTTTDASVSVDVRQVAAADTGVLLQPQQQQSPPPLSSTDKPDACASGRSGDDSVNDDEDDEEMDEDVLRAQLLISMARRGGGSGGGESTVAPPQLPPSVTNGGSRPVCAPAMLPATTVTRVRPAAPSAQQSSRFVTAATSTTASAGCAAVASVPSFIITVGGDSDTDSGSDLDCGEPHAATAATAADSRHASFIDRLDSFLSSVRTHSHRSQPQQPPPQPPAGAQSHTSSVGQQFALSSSEAAVAATTTAQLRKEQSASAVTNTLGDGQPSATRAPVEASTCNGVGLPSTAVVQRCQRGVSQTKTAAKSAAVLHARPPPPPPPATKKLVCKDVVQMLPRSKLAEYLRLKRLIIEKERESVLRRQKRRPVTTVSGASKSSSATTTVHQPSATAVLTADKTPISSHNTVGASEATLSSTGAVRARLASKSVKIVAAAGVNEQQQSEQRHPSQLDKTSVHKRLRTSQTNLAFVRSRSMRLLTSRLRHEQLAVEQLQQQLRRLRQLTAAATRRLTARTAACRRLQQLLLATAGGRAAVTSKPAAAAAVVPKSAGGSAPAAVPDVCPRFNQRQFVNVLGSQRVVGGVSGGRGAGGGVVCCASTAGVDWSRVVRTLYDPAILGETRPCRRCDGTCGCASDGDGVSLTAGLRYSVYRSLLPRSAAPAALMTSCVCRHHLLGRCNVTSCPLVHL